jgi:hypothetical protein
MQQLMKKRFIILKCMSLAPECATLEPVDQVDAADASSDHRPHQPKLHLLAIRARRQVQAQ